jgi:hypothetical protein
MSAPAVAISGDLATVRFDRFDLDGYGLFLRTKTLPEKRVAYDWEADAYTVTTPARFAPLLGTGLTAAARLRLPMAAHLFDYQRWAVGLALDAKRFGLWLDTGLGKTACFLEWARQVMGATGGKVLILCPASVVRQIQAEAERFYGDDLILDRLVDREALTGWLVAGAAHPLAIASYHLFARGQVPELRHLAGLVLDEASILKTGGGTIKWNLRNSALGIEYKLTCTATPAPNEAMEYASQASFLKTIRTDADILWTYFSKTKTGDWYVKPHAKDAFYRFMASWSLYLRDPARFGFGDVLATLPPPELIEERIPLTDEQRRRMTEYQVKSGKGMFGDDLGVTERAKLAQLARGFVYVGTGAKRTAEPVHALKPGRVAEIVLAEVLAGRQTLVWTTFDEEGEIVLREIGTRAFPNGAQRAPAVAILSGKQSDDERARILDRFKAGDLAAVISKPQLIGYGLNLQFVRSMVDSGLDDSFERRYQKFRRAYRFGQTERVRFVTPYVPELEGAMFENVGEKERRFLAEVAAQEDHYRTALDGMGVAA